MTRVTLGLAGPEQAGTSWRFEVAENFQEVVNRLFPLNPPASSLEARARMLFTTPEGLNVLVKPELVAVVEEVADDE